MSILNATTRTLAGVSLIEGESMSASYDCHIISIVASAGACCLVDHVKEQRISAKSLELRMCGSFQLSSYLEPGAPPPENN